MQIAAEVSASCNRGTAHAPGAPLAGTSGEAGSLRDPSGGGSGLLGLNGPARGWLPTMSGTDATGF